MSATEITMNKKLQSALTGAALFTVILMSSACDDKWSSMPDNELAAKSAECHNIHDPAPAMIQVCKNYQRECERRRENGVYVC